MGLGAPELLIILVILLLFAIPIWAIVDAWRHTPAEWNAVGQSRTVWLVLLIGGWFFGLSIIFSIAYLVWTRPKFQAIAGPIVS